MLLGAHDDLVDEHSLGRTSADPGFELPRTVSSNVAKPRYSRILPSCAVSVCFREGGDAKRTGASPSCLATWLWI
jgi:hypothetical protein